MVLVGLLALAGCDDGGPGGGPPQDAFRPGAAEDGGRTPDGGRRDDGGAPARDAARPGDGAPPSDAAPPRDADPRRDAGPTTDAGVRRDAAPPPADAGPMSDGGGEPAGPCPGPDAPGGPDTARWTDGPHTATVAVAGEGCQRTFTLRTDAPLRDGRPDNPRIIREVPDRASLQTGHAMFDALYALALVEVEENSVDAIRDGAFDEGNPLPCPPGGCFETGRLWNYVWTRDTAYAVDLGLAAVDPVRAANSLGFKLSARREGGDLQIVQDTGSGGSYPVSTDRVVWAFGARTLLRHWAGPDAEAFADRAYEAMVNTAAHDRVVAFDPTDGLYRGEQSFLDWREQSYPPWTRDDTVHLGMSKALSTNVGHYQLLRLLAELAEARDADAAATYAAQAEALRQAIRDRLWLEGEGQLSSFVTTGLDPAPARRFDLLGAALAVLTEVATPAQAARIVAGYPHTAKGPPVLWPQQQDIAIYHNRGIWPFVTAYWLKAARAVGNAAVVDHALASLVRGAALNLSNMENFEAVTGAAWVDEGPTSGPVVNSQRQLWSVAGYVAAVHDVVFGLDATAAGLQVRPFVTPWMRDTLFGHTDRVALVGYRYQGVPLNIVLRLPPVGTGPAPFAVQGWRLDARDLPREGALRADQLSPGAEIEVTLVAGQGDGGAITIVDDPADYQALFGPRPPSISAVVPDAGGGLRLSVDLDGEDAGDVTLTLYRDGEAILRDVPGAAADGLRDADVDPSVDGPCYTVEATFARTGTHSQHAAPACWWGPGAERIDTFDATAFEATGGELVLNHGRMHYQNWGDPGHALVVPRYEARFTGPHLLQVEAGNGAGSVNTGVTCAVKRVDVEEVDGGRVVGGGYLLMPHLGAWDRWAGSSFVEVDLVAGRTYRVVVHGDAWAVNMSVFDHFSRYTGGTGGRAGAFNRVNIAALKVLARTGR